MSGNINTRRHICHIRKKFLRDGVHAIVSRLSVRFYACNAARKFQSARACALETLRDVCEHDAYVVLTSDIYLTYDDSDLFPNHRLIRC